jgi:cellulose synthase/poly-beta-1,6-N-acetylglucosamine synthase-like glycosyltransferase
VDPAKVVVGITDADGRLDRDCLKTVAPYFADPQIASVQIAVRIANATTNLLTRLQDMEFVGFSAFVQKARDHLGSSGLGGNGQFTRLSALQELHSTRGGPWRTDALAEDLELGLALVCLGWKTRFCPHTFVAQQGLPHWGALFRQRTRWIQGHYSCWPYVSRLAKRPRISFLTRLDLIAYLLLVMAVIVVCLNLILGLLASFGIVNVINTFGAFMGHGALHNAFSLAFGALPLICFMYIYQTHAVHPFRWWELPAAGVIFTLYTYVWIFATVRALGRLAIGRRNWVKTPRVTAAESVDVEATTA